MGPASGRNTIPCRRAVKTQFLGVWPERAPVVLVAAEWIEPLADG
jgi:hypothetical protein